MWGKNMALPNGLNTEGIPSESEPDMLRAAAAKGKKLHVGIVGAGFAGLRCADVLLSHGHRVTIFEARNRVGGRVAQSNHLGHLVDLGPNWIHGTDNNPINKIAKQTGTQLHAWDEAQQIYNTDGTALSASEAGELAALLWDEGLIADAFRYSEAHKASIPASESLLDFFRAKAEKLFTELPEAEARRKRETLLLMCEMWGAYVGSPVSRQSLKFFWLEECIEGENPFVAETYHKILAHVAKKALEEADIRFETKVVGISGAVEGKKASIETSTGVVETFDEVVMTAPLGWLKRNKDVFKTGLTPRLESAIDSIGYGSLDKVYITFETAFWESAPEPNSPSDLPTPTSPIDPSHKTPNLTAKTTPLHQAPSSPSSTYPGFTHWLSPTYATPTNPSRFDIQAMNFAALPGSSRHPTLLFYIHGPCASHIGSLISSAPTPAARDAALLAFFAPYYTLLPHYSASDPRCAPRAVLATNWVSDEFAGHGSYANFQTGLERGDEDVEVMRHGMPEVGVWIAGEHTSPFVALGTSTGAWWSGEGVARRILGKSVQGVVDGEGEL